MAEEKKEKQVKPAKDHWFTLRGIRKEAGRVMWPKWRSTENTQGILANTTEVIVFSAFFALFFVLCNFGITYLLKFIGIGA